MDNTPFKIIDDLVSAITSPELQQRLLFLKIIFIAVSVALIGGIAYFIKNSRWWEFFYPRQHVEAFGFKGLEQRKAVRSWEKTKKRLDTEIPSEYKLAVIEADSLFNNILGRMGYSGETLAERLKKVPEGVFPNTEKIWQAHKIRNNIVHDPNYKLSRNTAREVVETYEKVFQHLEIFS